MRYFKQAQAKEVKTSEKKIREKDDKEERWQMQRCTRALQFRLEDLQLCNSKWKGHG